MSEKDFLNYIDAELISYYVYEAFYLKKFPNEFVDTLANSYSHIDYSSDSCLDTLLIAKDILNKDYGVDMMQLPFKNQFLIQELNEYELNKNNINI